MSVSREKRVMTALLLLAAVISASPAAAQHRSASAAVLQGHVVDRSNGEPLPGVNVFLSGTTRGATTDEHGRFVIHGVPPGAYDLVASMVGYRAASVPVEMQTGDVYRHRFRLRPATYELDEVNVRGERPRRWEELFERFRRQFVGTSAGARTTRILNPHVIGFESEGYAYEQLYASAEMPIEIRNEALGYRITFLLENFSWNRDREELQFDGYSFFEELTPSSPAEKARWLANRREALRGSRQHFLWALAHDRLEEEGFEVRQGRPPIARGAAPYVGDRVGAAEIVHPTDTAHLLQLRFDGFLRVAYRPPEKGGLLSFFTPSREEVSWLRTTAPEVLVHESGYLYPPAPLRVYGDMGRRRMAHLLPHGYVDSLRSHSEPASGH